jgi:hypothetical protein
VSGAAKVVLYDHVRINVDGVIEHLGDMGKWISELEVAAFRIDNEFSHGDVTAQRIKSSLEEATKEIQYLVTIAIADSRYALEELDLQRATAAAAKVRPARAQRQPKRAGKVTKLRRVSDGAASAKRKAGAS